MKKICVCFSGFNRNTSNSINLKKEFENKFKIAIKQFDCYYFTYNQLFETKDQLIDKEKISQNFKLLGFQNIFIQTESYDKSFFVQQILNNDINITSHNICPSPNRFLSFCYGFSKVINMIDSQYDYVFYMRLDFGVDDFIYKNINISDYLEKNVIIGQHLSGKGTIDPRFIAGKFHDMKKFDKLYEKFFQYFDKHNIKYNDHAYLWKYIENELKCDIIPIDIFINTFKAKKKSLEDHKNVQNEKYFIALQ